MNRRTGTSLTVATLSPPRHLTMSGQVRLVQALWTLGGMLTPRPATLCMRVLQTIELRHETQGRRLPF